MWNINFRKWIIWQCLFFLITKSEKWKTMVSIKKRGVDHKKKYSRGRKMETKKKCEMKIVKPEKVENENLCSTVNYNLFCVSMCIHFFHHCFFLTKGCQHRKYNWKLQRNGKKKSKRIFHVDSPLIFKNISNRFIIFTAFKTFKMSNLFGKFSTGNCRELYQENFRFEKLESC